MGWSFIPSTSKTLKATLIFVNKCTVAFNKVSYGCKKLTRISFKAPYLSNFLGGSTPFLCVEGGAPLQHPTPQGGRYQDKIVLWQLYNHLLLLYNHLQPLFFNLNTLLIWLKLSVTHRESKQVRDTRASGINEEASGKGDK